MHCQTQEARNLRDETARSASQDHRSIGVGGGGGNAVNNMIAEQLQGTEFIAANTDAQALTMSKATRLIQLGAHVTEGLGAGSLPEIGRAAAEESIDEIMDHLAGTHMCFVTAGMGGGTGTGAAPIIAQAARKAGILTVAVVTKPFTFEGKRRMQMAEEGIERLREAPIRSSSFRTRTCSGSPMPRPPSPMPSSSPTACSMPASAASPTSSSRKA
jgi:cell division protein FtsZ